MQGPHEERHTVGHRAVTAALIAAAAVIVWSPSAAEAASSASAPRADNSPSVNSRPEHDVAEPRGVPGECPQPGSRRQAETVRFTASGPSSIDLSSLRRVAPDTNENFDAASASASPRLPIEEADAAERQAALSSLTLRSTLEHPESQNPGVDSVLPGIGFEGLDVTQCCGGSGAALTPPDPDLAVGPNHIVTVVNSAFAIYSTNGVLLAGPTTLASFFAGVPYCPATSVTPTEASVLYDESADRFILGSHALNTGGGGSDYCIAATTGSDPTGTWHRYAVSLSQGFDEADYPNIGVGRDAIYLGVNVLRGSAIAESRVWAIEKAGLYAGDAALTVVTRPIASTDTSPHPMNVHGFAKGNWPTAGPHYFIASRDYVGVTYSVWSWSDPFGVNELAATGVVDLVAATGVPALLLQEAPQSGGAPLKGLDLRPMDAEWHDGEIWTTQTIGCDSGGEPVNCMRWARIDPLGPTVLDAGVVASPGEYRFVGDLAVNRCGDMGIGYTKSSRGMFPSVWATRRESGDPPGTTQAEFMMRPGEIPYTATGSVLRWGYDTTMTVAPNGETFWYVGQYSKSTNPSLRNWGTWIGSFTFLDCGGPPGYCGNGVIEPGGVCDPGDPGSGVFPDLNGQTCLDIGCSFGDLECDPDCVALVPTSCFDCVGEGAGFIPGAKNVPGPPLLVSRDGSQITLDWSPACGEATDYAVYEGTLGNPGSQMPLRCTTSGLTSTIVTPGDGQHFYLIVALGGGDEGSYGRKSDGSERSPSAMPCLTQFIGACP